jgi:succinyl-CoA synthetase beta subunit
MCHNYGNFNFKFTMLPGIMRCDYIAEGVIKATKELKLDIPLVVRLKGTKEQEAKQYVLSEFLTLIHC